MTDERMEFVNVDINRVDEGLTATYTKALETAGFRSPARLAAGKPTILKPFDEGYFMVDAGGDVFHVKRFDGKPRIVKTPIPDDLGIRHIKVSESKRRLYYGFLLTDDGRLFLISYDDYRLVALPTEGYDADRMDYKLLLKPLYPTAVFGNDEAVHAVAMTPDFQPIDRYSRPVPGTRGMPHDRIFRALFPFAVTLDDPTGGYLSWKLNHHGWQGMIGTAVSLLILLLLIRRRRTRFAIAWPDILFVALGGVFGLVAAFMVPVRREAGLSDRRSAPATNPATTEGAAAD